MNSFIQSLRSEEGLQFAILLLFCLPVFFQLSGTIFSAKDAVYDSQASLLLVPLPIAAGSCFAGIIMLLRPEKSFFGTGFVFSFFVLMTASAVFSGSGAGTAPELDRFIHLVQFVLPAFGLILGHLYKAPRSDWLRFEAVILYILLIIIPLEVIVSVIRGNTLSAYLYGFSLYQHFQYLPVIFLAWYLIAAANFAEHRGLRVGIVALAPFMGIYLALSLSVLAMLLAVIGGLILLAVLGKRGGGRYAATVIVLVSVAFAAYLPAVQDTQAYQAKFGRDYEAEPNRPKEAGDLSIGADSAGSEKGSEPWITNILNTRLDYWQFYFDGLLLNPKTFLFGHRLRPDRAVFPSAYNFYLDLAYNFGAVSLLPFVVLIVLSVRGVLRKIPGARMSAGLTMLALVVAYLVLIDNFFKVGLSQPYPGMMMYFLWGYLLAECRRDTGSTISGSEESDA